MSQLQLEHTISAPRHFARGKYHAWGVCCLLLALYFALRLPNLSALPIFCDEAAYLRWAQLIRQDPLHNYWVSMRDAKLPFHYWLLAIFYLPNADPIFAGRLLSILTGAAMIPVLIAIGTELERLSAVRNIPAAIPVARLFGPLAALFMITSPLIASYQRMALAEPLLLLESVTLAWLSLRLARRIVENAASGMLLSGALVLALTWLATLLTKQNFSYLLWVFPPLGLALYCTKENWRGLTIRFLPYFLLATAVGLLLFAPAVVTTDMKELSLRLFYKPSFFRVPGISHAAIFMQNLVALVSPRIQRDPHWWPHDSAAPLDDGSLYVYLTPPIFALVIIGALWLLRRRSFIPLAFFGTWFLLLLGTVVANHSWIRTRYALLGIFPLLLLAAWIVADLLSPRRTPDGAPIPATASKRVMATSILVALLAWPTLASLAQLSDYQAPTKTRLDRAEYIAGSSSGESVQMAVEWLKHQAALHPITVITATGFGTENDFVWLALSNDPNVQLLCTDDLPFGPLPAPAADGTVIFCTEQWFPERTANIHLDPARPVYTLQGLNPNIDGTFVCNPVPNQLVPFPERALLTRVIPNPPTSSREKPCFATAIVQLNVPHIMTASAQPFPR